MTTKSLTVLARITAKSGMESQVRDVLLSIVNPSRNDPGCLNYDLHQAQENPALFLFHENWTSKSHLDQHLRTPHVQAALGKLGQLLAQAPEITHWERIG
jgi:quinol monooxygenase YgiN